MSIKDPPGYDSDHFLLAAELTPASAAEQKEYLRGQKTIPATHNNSLESREADAKMVQLLSFKAKEKAKETLKDKTPRQPI